MANIHLKTTIALIYIFGFILFSLLGLFLLGDNDTGWLLLFPLACGYSGVGVVKELCEDLDTLILKENFLLKGVGYLYTVVAGLIFLFFWFFSYLVLFPLYLIFFVGFIFGKGLNAAKE